MNPSRWGHLIASLWHDAGLHYLRVFKFYSKKDKNDLHFCELK
jgi:hypothetical protein